VNARRAVSGAAIVLGASWATALALAGCQPVTFDFTDGDGGADVTVPDAGDDGRGDGHPAFDGGPGVRDAAWPPPDGCGGDPSCVACANASDCMFATATGPWFCDPETKHCAQCRTSTDCSSGGGFAESCVYAQCLIPCDPNDMLNSACGRYMVCHPRDRVCVQCFGNQFGNPYCNSPHGPLICSVTGHCVACVSNTDCNGQPEAPLCGPNGQCVACVTDTDCDGGFCTQAGFCHSPPVQGDF
jgi:hypothetical protein